MNVLAIWKYGTVLEIRVRAYNKVQVLGLPGHAGKTTAIRRKVVRKTGVSWDHN